MSVIVNKTATGEIDLFALQKEINADPTIVPSCLSISLTDTNLKLEFAAALSGDEDTALDALISGHVPPVEQIDVRQLPFSPTLGKKLHVHRSFKPESDKTIYSVWTGSGDDLVGGTIGGGDILHFTSTVDTGTKTIEAEFNSDEGRVWIHEGYLAFDGAGPGDYMEANVRAHPTPIQTSTDLDLILSGNKILPAPSGPGTGTHGFDLVTGPPVPISRSFSMNGGWDISDGVLVPNYNDTGAIALNRTERTVHRFHNKIPCFGTSPFFSMGSDETIELRMGTFLQIKQFNVSNTVWSASVMIEIYRERTHAQQ